MQNTETASAPVLYGAAEIAQFTGLSVRKVFYLHETGHLPTFKLGGKICMRPATWLAHVERLERGEAA